MSIESVVYDALVAVTANAHATELPKRPAWPAIVFDVDTQPEQTWVIGGGYDQHIVTVVSLAKTKAEIVTMRDQIRAAMEAVVGYMGDEDKGDTEYEGDAEVYGYFQNFRIRLQKD